MGTSKKWDLLSEQNGALAVLAAAFLTGVRQAVFWPPCPAEPVRRS